MLTQFLVNGFASGCQISIFAFACWLVYASARFVDISQGGIFVLSGYTYLVAVEGGIAPVFAILIALGLGMVIGAVSDIIFFRPLSRCSASMPVLLLTSLALYEVFMNIAAMMYGNSTRLVSSVPQAWTLGSLVLSRSQALQVVIAVGIGWVWAWVFLQTKIGLYLRSAAQEPSLFVSFGLNLIFMRSASFCAAGALVALAGCVSANDTGINPDRGMPAMLDALVAVLLGGTNSVFGPILGAITLGLAKGIVGWQFSERWESAVTFSVLIIVLMKYPGGLRALVSREA